MAEMFSYQNMKFTAALQSLQHLAVSFSDNCSPGCEVVSWWINSCTFSKGDRCPLVATCTHYLSERALRSRKPVLQGLSLSAPEECNLKFLIPIVSNPQSPGWLAMAFNEPQEVHYSHNLDFCISDLIRVRNKGSLRRQGCTFCAVANSSEAWGEKGQR